MFVRKKRNASGSVSVQVIDKSGFDVIPDRLFRDIVIARLAWSFLIPNNERPKMHSIGKRAIALAAKVKKTITEILADDIDDIKKHKL